MFFPVNFYILALLFSTPGLESTSPKSGGSNYWGHNQKNNWLGQFSYLMRPFSLRLKLLKMYKF